MRLLLASLATVLLAAAAAASAAPLPQRFPGCARADFPSSGTTVRAVLCRATGGDGAGVIVLHGCGGFSTFDHRLTTGLPAKGISTLDVDYFDPTPPPGKRGWCGGAGGSGGEDPFPTWIRVADDAAASLRRTPGIRSVGAVGWSLGGAVVVGAAASATGKPPFDAIAGFSTGFFGGVQLPARFPPTILLSGGPRDAIPLADTEALFQTLRARHVAAQLYVYPGNGTHEWPGAQGTAGIAHAAAFLNRHLG